MVRIRYFSSASPVVWEVVSCHWFQWPTNEGISNTKVPDGRFKPSGLLVSISGSKVPEGNPAKVSPRERSYVLRGSIIASPLKLGGEILCNAKESD